jgi:hypothetical protein
LTHSSLHVTGAHLQHRALCRWHIK